MAISVRKAAVTALGAAAVAVFAPATAAAASSPAVSVSAQPGSVRVDFDFRGVDVALGVTCITYVVGQQGALDAAEPSGRIDAQPAGSRFSVSSTSTSSATYIGETGPVFASPRAITPGPYNVFWGCQDAEGQQWENIYGRSGRPFASPITVTVPGDTGEGATAVQQPSQPSGPGRDVPPPPSAPADLVRQGLQTLSGFFGFA